MPSSRVPMPTSPAGAAPPQRSSTAAGRRGDRIGVFVVPGGQHQQRFRAGFPVEPQRFKGKAPFPYEGPLHDDCDSRCASVAHTARPGPDPGSALRPLVQREEYGAPVFSPLQQWLNRGQEFL